MVGKVLSFGDIVVGHNHDESGFQLPVVVVQMGALRGSMVVQDAGLAFQSGRKVAVYNKEMVGCCRNRRSCG